MNSFWERIAREVSSFEGSTINTQDTELPQFSRLGTGSSLHASVCVYLCIFVQNVWWGLVRKERGGGRLGLWPSVFLFSHASSVLNISYRWEEGSEEGGGSSIVRAVLRRGPHFRGVYTINTHDILYRATQTVHTGEKRAVRREVAPPL